ncbi:secondary thiamine-phosphate synthase enzyme YjbQ [Prosthecochloris sp. SCSIO W1103]|uniref:secondary thiamine-phosphate synthase enzyme YjbQ n=1 Tax=Prosthecochloris sp. SCSIO W1103 TaxID=2992244 RepID=UPI00223D15E9|nr:secondary thiamine-phosphate synthase enzyme YjbQ [Prosthecochloris sp. SCSIO W1103]UZJ36582.1 secondary thiamine-phosphate synthase enzyme YjbQ [Prosthecochloris sp. SCSIO W1103]
MICSKTIHITTKGFSDIIDLTNNVENVIDESGIREGIANISAIGSTASITTMEFEPALVEDFKEKLEQLVSCRERSRHSETWGDDNGFSHMRASLMGPGITMPVSKGKLVRGTWQQVVYIDHDNRPRDREVFIQIMGEQ